MYGRSDFLRKLNCSCDDKKVRSPIVERRVAGMASEDDAAERGCSRPGTSATRVKSADR